MAAGSWVFLALYLPTFALEQHSSRMLAGENLGFNIFNYSDTQIIIIIFVLFVGIFIHYFCNFVFTINFLLKEVKKDKKFKDWKEKHKFVFCGGVGFSFLCSFQIFRIFYCGLCNFKSFQADIEDFGIIGRGLVKFGFFDIFGCHFCMIAAQIMILNYFEKGYWIWMFALDSLIITVLLTIILFCDIRRIDRVLLRYHITKFLHVEDDELKLVSDPKETPEPSPTKLYLKKGQSKSITGLNLSSSYDLVEYSNVSLVRNNSFPKLEKVNVDIHELLEFFEKNKVIEEPAAEIFLDIKETSFIEDNTFIEEPVTNGEFFFSFKESKPPKTRNNIPIFFLPKLEQRTEEFTEIIAFTEEASDDSKELIELNSTTLRGLQEEEPMIEDFSFESQQIIHSSGDETDHLGTILEENELELEKAIADLDEPEFVTVTHKETGRRVKIKRDFKGARIVDIENNVIESLPPIDIKDIDFTKTIIDESDVRFATVTTKSGQTLKVKRNFKGARIIDLEKRVRHPFSFLIGKSLDSEQDIKLSSAYPDPEDPEILIVTHKATNKDIKIRKTFQNAFPVDEVGQIVPLSKPINRVDFDIPKTIIDSHDIHLAILSHKQTKARIRVRRDFKGAKIIDLEKKTQNDESLSNLNTLNELSDLNINDLNDFESIQEVSEPENLSIDLSDLEFPELYKVKRKKDRMEGNQELKEKRNLNSPGRLRLQELAKIIDEEAKVGSFIVEHAKGLKTYEVKKEKYQIPHYRDLDDEFDTEFRVDSELGIDDSLELLDFEIQNKHKNKSKKLKKHNLDPRLKDLGEIYLEVQEVKGIEKRRVSDDLGLLNLEKSFDRKELISRTAPLGKAGEQIIIGKMRK